VKATTEFKEEEYYEEVAMTEVSKCEEEYLDFLEQFGHIDFTHIEFLPILRTVKELKEIKNKNWVTSNQMIRTNALLDSTGNKSGRPSLGSMIKPPKENWEDIKRRHLKGKKGRGNDLTEIREEFEEETYIDVNIGEAGGESADVLPAGKHIYAERYNFSF